MRVRLITLNLYLPYVVAKLHTETQEGKQTVALKPIIITITGMVKYKLQNEPCLYTVTINYRTEYIFLYFV